MKKSEKELVGRLSHYALSVEFAKVYLLADDHKQDSVYVEASDFFKWKDSLSFSVDVPTSFLRRAKQFSISPVYHIAYSTPERGNESKDGAGSDKAVQQIKVKVKSDPQGATVYMIPKLIFLRNPIFANFDAVKWDHYRVTSGSTTAWWYVQEYVYVTIYVMNNKRWQTEFSPSYLHPLDSCYLKLN